MKKTILLCTACLSIIILAASFKNYDTTKKEYVTVYYNDFNMEVAISKSNGDFKNVEFEKPKGHGDQTQLLKLINEQEAEGYKIVQYSYGTSASQTAKSVVSVLMAK